VKTIVTLELDVGCEPIDTVRFIEHIISCGTLNPGCSAKELQERFKGFRTDGRFKASYGILAEESACKIQRVNPRP